MPHRSKLGGASVNARGLEVDEPTDRPDLFRDDQGPLFRPDAELLSARQEIGLGLVAGGVVRRHIVEHDPLGGALVPAPHVGPSRTGLEDHGNAVEIVMPGMKDVSAHRAFAQLSTEAVEQYLSNASVSSAAIC